jgi:hypothetical protein
MGFPYINPGDATQLYLRAEKIPGFFNYDDAQHFQLVLRMQVLMGVTGDLLEIGSWKGRSAAFMSFFVHPGERLIVSDVFSQPASDVYSEYPSVEDVKTNITKINPDIAAFQLMFLEGNSSSMQLPADVNLRFAHVDAGHSFQECYQDLINITPRVIHNGIVVIDDYGHPDWPEVKPATDTWLKEYRQFRILGELNRNIAKGKKLYLINTASDNHNGLQ